MDEYNPLLPPSVKVKLIDSSLIFSPENKW